MFIRICNRQEADKLLRQHYPETGRPNVISIADAYSPNPMYSAWNYERLLYFKFNDVEEDGIFAPCPQHIKTMIEFARGLNMEKDLIVHCEGGVSRSAAAAFIIASLHMPLASVLDYFSDRIGTLYPNMLMLKLADKILGHEGKLLELGNQFNALSFAKRMEKDS